MKNAFLICLLMVSLSACGPLKDMGDMKDTTNHMDATTSHLDQTTTDMAKKTSDEMHEMIAEMKDMKGDMTDMKGITKEKMSEMITEMKSMKGTTEHMSSKMDGMYDLTKIMSGEMEGVLHLTQQMLGKMDGLYDLTKDVAAVSTHMATTTDNMLEITHNLYTDNRQNGATVTRHFLLDDLNDPNMTPGLAIKASIAAKYFMAFEFQVWKNEFTDTEQKRLDLEGNAVEDFFNEMTPYFKGYNDYSPLSVENSTKNLMMISVVMSQPNPNQLDAAKQYGFTPITLDQILFEGLKQKANVNSGKLNPVPPQVTKVLQQEEATKYLLNVRHNTLAMVAITKIVGIDPDYLKKAYGLDLAGKLAKLVIKPIDLSEQNIEQMNFEIGYLAQALQVRQDLQKYTGNAIISPDVAFALKQLKVTFDVSKIPGASKAEIDGKTSRVETMNELIAALNKFKPINGVTRTLWDHLL